MTDMDPQREKVHQPHRSDDVELGLRQDHHVHTASASAHSSFTWSSLTVEVPDRATKSPINILDDAAGCVHSGEMLALMGPSGSGKTTLLNALAHRNPAANARQTGEIRFNGSLVSLETMRKLSAYVEQEDQLIGSLTVKETIMFAAKLSLPKSTSKNEAMRRVDELIYSFGLGARADTIVGTPIKKGLSGGQKKRLSVASQLITEPKVLFLDEPTSGLDSTTTFEVMSYIRDVARRNNIIVIASIHQPSTATFQLFDKLCLVSKGKTCYFGPVAEAANYFAEHGHHIPPQTSAPEFLLDLINTDIDKHGGSQLRVQEITKRWNASQEYRQTRAEISSLSKGDSEAHEHHPSVGPGSLTMILVFLRRSWIKARRDVLPYGIRVAMYLCLAILMGTVFLRLQTEQKYIQPFINAIFFGGAFMSFMAVAYVPSFLEDLHTFQSERANGLAKPAAFMISNFLIGTPFLFLIALLFSIVQYWLSNFRPDGSAFMKYVMWLFLDLLAAESLVVFVSSIFPIFVIALAITAFSNGLWMCVNGFLVPMTILNPFWKYVFHYIDYQAYVFQGMMVNEFAHRNYDCVELRNGEGYQCMYPSRLSSEGKIAGEAVLKQFDISQGKEGLWIGIIIAIVVAYRLMAWLILVFRK